MSRVTAVARAIRDSMLVGWLLLGAFALALIFSIRTGIGWLSGITLLLAIPVVVYAWARALCRLERRANGG